MSKFIVAVATAADAESARTRARVQALEHCGHTVTVCVVGHAALNEQHAHLIVDERHPCGDAHSAAVRAVLESRAR